MMINNQMLNDPHCENCGEKTFPLVSLYGKFCCGKCVLAFKKEQQKQIDNIFQKINE